MDDDDGNGTRWLVDDNKLTEKSNHATLLKSHALENSKQQKKSKTKITDEVAKWQRMDDGVPPLVKVAQQNT